MVSADDGVELLTQGADGGVAHVVVDILEACLQNGGTLGPQDLRLVSAGPNGVGQQLHVDGKQIGDQQSML